MFFLWEKTPQISLGFKEKKIYHKFSIKRTLTITPNQNWSDFICFPFKLPSFQVHNVTPQHYFVQINKSRGHLFIW
jgi:hypothetical protein